MSIQSQLLFATCNDAASITRADPTTMTTLPAIPIPQTVLDDEIDEHAENHGWHACNGRCGVYFAIGTSRDGTNGGLILYIENGADQATVAFSTFESQQPLENESMKFVSLAFDKKRNRLVAGSDDARIVAFDISEHDESNLTLINQTKDLTIDGHSVWVHVLSFRTDYDVLVTRGPHNTFKVVEADTYTTLQILEHEGGVSGYPCAFSPDGQYLLTGHSNGEIIVLDAYTFQLQHSIQNV